MDAPRKHRGAQFWLKAAGVAFAIYLASFGALMWMDNNGMISRPPPALVQVFYLPLSIFYGLVTRGLK